MGDKRVIFVVWGKFLSCGEFGAVYASGETLHEIYYLSKAEGVSTDELIARGAALTAIDNLPFMSDWFSMTRDPVSIHQPFNLGPSRALRGDFTCSG